MLRDGRPTSTTQCRKLGAVEIARQAYQAEGLAVFFRGLGICSVRAFIVNAVQWAVYEWMMRLTNRDRALGRSGVVSVYDETVTN